MGRKDSIGSVCLLVAESARVVDECTEEVSRHRRRAGESVGHPPPPPTRVDERSRQWLRNPPQCGPERPRWAPQAGAGRESGHPLLHALPSACQTKGTGLELSMSVRTHARKGRAPRRTRSRLLPRIT